MAAETVVTDDLEGCRFDPSTPRALFRGVTVRNVDFSGLELRRLTAESSSFEECNFAGVILSYGPLGSVPPNLFRQCSFAGADLRGVDPGDARFERCIFDGARIEEWMAFCAEFIECRFATTLTKVKFSGTRFECEKFGFLRRRRKRNEFRGNDFRDANLLDTSFVMGIKLSDQLLPDDPVYVRIDRLQERIERVRKEVSRWSDGEARLDALAMLEAYADDAEGQDELFTRRDSVPLAPEVRDRVWQMLENAL